MKNATSIASIMVMREDFDKAILKGIGRRASSVLIKTLRPREWVRLCLTMVEMRRRYQTAKTLAISPFSKGNCDIEYLCSRMSAPAPNSHVIKKVCIGKRRGEENFIASYGFVDRNCVFRLWKELSVAVS
jgi:hypothetical protein